MQVMIYMMVHMTLYDMMASFMFDNEYFMYGLEILQKVIIVTCSTMSKDFNIDELEGVQSSNADVIGNMRHCIS